MSHYLYLVTWIVRSQWFIMPIRREQRMKKLTKAFFLVVALVLMAGLGLVSAGPAAACGNSP